MMVEWSLSSAAVDDNIPSGDEDISVSQDWSCIIIGKKSVPSKNLKNYSDCLNVLLTTAFFLMKALQLYCKVNANTR